MLPEQSPRVTVRIYLLWARFVLTRQHFDRLFHFVYLITFRFQLISISNWQALLKKQHMKMPVLLLYWNGSWHINATLGYKIILLTKILNQIYNRISIHSLNPKALLTLCELCKWGKQGNIWPKQMQSCPLYYIVSCASQLALSYNVHTPCRAPQKHILNTQKPQVIFTPDQRF